MTESLSEVLKNCGYPLSTNEILENNLVGNEHNVNITMKELVNFFVEKVNKEINKENGFQEGSYAQNIQERIINTADCLLDNDTQLLKSILVGMKLEDGGNGMGETVCQTAYTAEKIIDLYMDKVLKFEFKEKHDIDNEMLDEVFNSIKEEMLQSLNSMVITSGVNKGKYNLELIIQKLEECAAKYEVPESTYNVPTEEEKATQVEDDRAAVQAEIEALKKRMETDITNSFDFFKA